MSKKTVGIMTFWDCPNFGTFLQAYALRNVVKDLFSEYEVKQIAYSNKRHLDVYYSIIRPSAYKYFAFRPEFYLDIIKRYKNRQQIYNFRKFKDNYDKLIPHTPVYTAKELENIEFETIILGSDIIWDYSVYFFDHDPLLFGCNMKYNNLISYAASFGTVKRDYNHPQYVTDAISNMDAISVRDANSSMIVKDITNREAEVVLDPSLLWDFKHDMNIEIPKIDYKYVAVYGSYFTDNQIGGLKKYCHENGLKIVALDTGLDQYNWCDLFIDASMITPFEWCGYIKGAELLMTSTFHGFLFGLIFWKKIIFNATNFMKAKLTDFLKDLDLYDIMVNTLFEDQIKYEWNYAKINTILNDKKDRSIDFLKSNILKLPTPFRCAEVEKSIL